MPSIAAAQAYPQLHVVALSQHADRAAVEPNGTFHLTIHAKIAQRRERLDELILGSFENCEIISNETVRTAQPDGTDFVERLTVQALTPGAATISPAYIDALDPALGKPMRFSSNAVRVEVLGTAPLAGALNNLGATLRRLLLAVAIVAGLFAAAFVVVVLFVRRRRRPATVVPAAPVAATAPPPAAPAGIRERLAGATDAYRRERSPATLLAVRAALLEFAGAAPGATLIDALRALGDRDRQLRFALLAAEAAAFGPALERTEAGDRMLAAIAAFEPAVSNASAWTR
jgi:hypothetical protein